MFSDAHRSIVELMDQLLGSGWYLITSQRLDGWPDTWALARDWMAADPNWTPPNIVHELVYGTTVVRDVVGFWPDGSADARRLDVVHDEILWATSGAGTETVHDAMIRSAPPDCVLEPSRSPFRGDPTSFVLALFRVRDWRLFDIDERGSHFRYTQGPGSAGLDRPRFYRGQLLEPLGITPLSCRVVPNLDEIRLTGWRVHTGCPAHIGALETTRLHDPTLPHTLDRYESAAATADLAALAHCVVYGDCSTHELDMSIGYPPTQHVARR